jgi:hypothetical protein
MKKVKVFRRHDKVDAFVVTDLYHEIAEDLGLTEWNPVVWIGRLFTMDNDLGEHWFDNWDAREVCRAQAGLTQEEAFKLLIVDPDRFKDGRDGPCHTAEFRKAFWTSVLDSLELDPELLFEEARRFNEADKAALEESPDDQDYMEDVIEDLEARIEKWKVRLSL